MNYYEEESYRSFNIKPWLKLKRFFKPYTKNLTGLTILMLVTALMDLSIPLFQKYAVDNFIAKSTTEGLTAFIGAYGAVLTVMALSVTLFIRLAIVVEMHIGMDLRKEIFEHLQNLSLSYYNTTPVGYILARTLSDTNKIGSMIAWGLVDVFLVLCLCYRCFHSNVYAECKTYPHRRFSSSHNGSHNGLLSKQDSLYQQGVKKG
jgi:ATP-binding cassette subfamily B protein